MRRLTLALFLLVALPASAAVLVVPTDGELIQNSHAIVVASVTDINSEFTIDGPIVTNIDLDVEEVLKGSISTSKPLRLREPGGSVGRYFSIVSGSPHYWTANRALIFLKHTDDGQWRTYGMSLGKFDFVMDAQGRQLAVRWAGQADILAWTPEGHPHEERLRDMRLFLAFIRMTANTAPSAPRLQPGPAEASLSAEFAYVVDDIIQEDLSFRLPTTDAHYPPLAYTYGKFRWFRFDKNEYVTFETSGTQPGYDAVGAAQRGLAAWTNDPGSNVDYRLGGTTSAGFTQETAVPQEAINAIVFDSSTDVPEGYVAWAQWFAGPCDPSPCMYKGDVFDGDIIEADVVVKSGLSVSQKVFDEIVTHELGHTLGLRHSDEGIPSSTAAVMKTVLSGNYGATLGPWDVEAVRHVYEQPSTSSTPPAVSFTDDPLIPGVTVIKAIHLVELRNAVNSWRTAAGLPAITAWTDADPAGATIKAVHILELRNALEPALKAFGRTPVFSSGVAQGQPVRAIHFQELRDQMK